MQSKKVVLLIDKLINGGAERVVCLWANFLFDAGYDVTMVTYYHAEHEYSFNPAIKRINLYPDYAAYQRATAPLLFTPDTPSPLDPAALPATIQDLVARLNRVLDQLRPDLIIPFLTTPNIIATLITTRAPVTVTQTIRNSPWDKPEAAFLRALRDESIRRAGSVILQNQEQAAYFTAAPFRAVQTYLVPNPLHPDISRWQKKHYGPIQKIIAVGRLQPAKNYPFMIETIKILRDEYHYHVTLDIYGVGQLQDQLQHLIGENHLQDQITLRGFAEDIFNTEINYDLFCMTSLYEGMPNALMEAMGLGLPCLVTAFRTGARELINDGVNGWIVTGDAHQMAAKIMQINDTAGLKRIGEQARADMQRYDRAHSLRALTACLDDLLTGGVH